MSDMTVSVNISSLTVTIDENLSRVTAFPLTRTGDFRPATIKKPSRFECCSIARWLPTVGKNDWTQRRQKPQRTGEARRRT